MILIKISKEHGMGSKTVSFVMTLPVDFNPGINVGILVVSISQEENMA